MATIRKCKTCAGLGIHWKRLEGVQDDGEDHTVRCWSCKGAGYLDERGKPYHLNVVKLGR